MAEEVSQNVDFPKVLRAYTQNQPILNEWTNHSSFYAIYPRYYFTFANQWLRKWLAWFDAENAVIMTGEAVHIYSGEIEV